MGSSKKPPKQDPAPPPATVTGADAAQEQLDAKAKEKKRYDFSKTILARGGLGSPAPAGTQSTLGT